MADVIKTRGTLQLVQEFTDGDDRTLSLDNPRSDLEASDITELADYMKTNKIVIGDKAGADFTRIKSAKKISQTTRYLDLND